MLVHRAEPGEQLTEVVTADGHERRQPRRRAERGAAADPVPDAEDVLCRDPGGSGRVDVRRDSREVPTDVIPKRRRRPSPGGLRVHARLQRAHRLRDDDEERLRGIEVSRGLGQVGGVDVRDEPDVDAARRVRPERLARHRGPEVASPDPDVHDGADALPGRSHPLARANAVSEGDGSIELLVHVLDDIPSPHHERPRARHPQRHVQGGATLRDVDGRTAKHRLDVLCEPTLRSQLPEELQRVVGDEVLRVVDVEAGSLGGHPLAAPRIAVEELPQVQVADLGVMPLEPPPRCALAETVSHVASPRPGVAPRRPRRVPSTRRRGRHARRPRSPRRRDRPPRRALRRSCPG